MNCTLRENHIIDGMQAAKEELAFMEKNYPSVVPAAMFRCCLKVIEYIPRILKYNEKNVEYFKWLQKELRPFLPEVLKDNNVSVHFKIQCIAVCVGYAPTRALWKAIDKIKGRIQA